MAVAIWAGVCRRLRDVASTFACDTSNDATRQTVGGYDWAGLSDANSLASSNAAVGSAAQ
jgi:hypothetical protein